MRTTIEPLYLFSETAFPSMELKVKLGAVSPGGVLMAWAEGLKRIKSESSVIKYLTYFILSYL